MMYFMYTFKELGNSVNVGNGPTCKFGNSVGGSLLKKRAGHSLDGSPAFAVLPHAAFNTFWRKSGNALRPYIERLINFNLVIFPSTGPLLQGKIKPASTASISDLML